MQSFDRITSHRVVWRGYELENDHESDEYGLAVRKSESRIQRLKLVQVGEESEHQENVNLETKYKDITL